LESKSLGSVTSKFTVLAQLEESEVDPCYEKPELDENVWRGTEEDDEDVRDKEVDTGEGLDD
jgi:hypothetical protein